MSNVVSFQEYAPSLSDKSKAQKIYEKIKELDPSNNEIIVDFNGLMAMTTICARMIFGRLYVELGGETFKKNLLLKNAIEPIRIVMKWGISKEVENSSCNDVNPS